MFSDSNETTVFWTAQQQRITDAILAKVVEIVEFDLAIKLPEEEERIPLCITHTLCVLFMSDILIPADAHPHHFL